MLIGAWADIADRKQILDIGTGTGLIALMAAQRSQATVTGIEINPDAALQAQENADRSPWQERIRIVRADLKEFAAETLFDAILSNPPYFSGTLECPDNNRNTARHHHDLSFRELMRHAARLLHPQGELSLILPTESVNEILYLAMEQKLYPSRKTWVRTTPKSVPKRCMLAFRFTPVERVAEQTLTIAAAPATYSEEYKRLTQDFYLKM